jgi:hypothetical protein
MNAREPMKNLWTVLPKPAAADSVHSLRLRSASFDPI